MPLCSFILGLGKLIEFVFLYKTEKISIRKSDVNLRVRRAVFFLLWPLKYVRLKYQACHSDQSAMGTGEYCKDMQKGHHFNKRKRPSQFILSGQNNILPSKVQKSEVRSR